MQVAVAEAIKRAQEGEKVGTLTVTRSASSTGAGGGASNGGAGGGEDHVSRLIVVGRRRMWVRLTD
jgi:hypothetical protein